MKNSIDIKTHDYFPFHMIVVGIACLLMAVIISMMYPILAVVLFILGLIMLSTHYRLFIDPEQKVYREYLWILGFKNGEIQPYEHINDIRIKHITQSIEYGFVSRVSGRKKVYCADLKVDEHDSIFVGEHRNELKLLKKVNKLAEGLHTNIRKSYE